MEQRTMYGRRVIYSDTDEITPYNVLEVLEKALSVHHSNRAEIQYLYDYYRGKQPILQRTKEFREEICNKIVENRANEIVSFKVGYLMGEPIQYVSRGNGDKFSEAINRLNEYMFAEDKAVKDKELADWFTICGTAYRMIHPDPVGDEDEAPFEIYTLDPRDTFVVYHSGLGNKPLMGVKYVTRENGQTVYSIYTPRYYFEVVGDGGSAYTIVKAEGHIIGDIPIIEYPANSARLGAFEIVLPLLDAMNNVASNRMDGVEQFIQSIMVIKGANFDADDMDGDGGFTRRLQENGGLLVPTEASVEYLTQELNQSQTQTLVDYMYQTVLTICGMPNRNGGRSTSDTGSAVIMRDGWSSAEARAKDSELMFKLPEKRFLKLAIEICNASRDMDLKLSAIEIRFTRRNYENIQQKAQVLTTMLANGQIHPRLAFEHSGMFVDPELAYTESTEYANARQREQAEELDRLADAETARAKVGVGETEE